MLNEKYNLSLKIIRGANKKLAERIISFISDIPENLKSLIEQCKKSGGAIRGDERWNFVDNGEELTITLGKRNNDNVDYMSLYINRTREGDLQRLDRYVDKKIVGYVAFYVYDDPDKKRARTKQLIYEYNVIKRDKDYCCYIKGNVDMDNKKNVEILEKNGYLEFARDVYDNGSYSFNLSNDKIIKRQ